MSGKTAPRQNDLISTSRYAIAERIAESESAPERLITVRRVLVLELETLIVEATTSGKFRGERSIDG